VTRWQWVATSPFNSAEVGAALVATGSGAQRVARLCPGYDGYRDGVVAIAGAKVEEVMERARQRLAKEELIGAALDPGGTTVEVLGLASGPPP
jgi:hypothetical protein